MSHLNKKYANKNLYGYLRILLCSLTLMSGLSQAAWMSNQQEYNQHKPHLNHPLSVASDVMIQSMQSQGMSVRYINHLTPQELSRLEINQAAAQRSGAGIDVLTGIAIGAAFLVMSDYMGYTDVFPFIKAQP